MAGSLTPRQQRFVLEYLVDLNATQAAIRAGYSAKTAKQQGARLLTYADIAAEVQTRRERLSARTQVTAERVIQELARLAFVDPRAIFNPDGSMKPVTDWDEDTARALSGCEVTEEFAGRGEERESVGFTKKVKFWDKKGALELLGKHLALFTERVEHSGPGGGPIPVEVAGRGQAEALLSAAGIGAAD